jgi:hypothetical protein
VKRLGLTMNFRKTIARESLQADAKLNLARSNERPYRETGWRVRSTVQTAHKFEKPLTLFPSQPHLPRDRR